MSIATVRTNQRVAVCLRQTLAASCCALGAAACSSASTFASTPAGGTIDASVVDCNDRSVPLAGAAYDIAHSRFAFGSTPTEKVEAGYTKWIGVHGVVAIAANGRAIGVMNGGAPETELPDWSADANALRVHVRDYLAGFGIPACQIQNVAMSSQSSESGSMSGGPITSGPSRLWIDLVRAVDEIPIVESVASARMNSNDQSTSEALYWPPIPAAVVTSARAMRDRLRDAGELATYRAKLPVDSRGEGRVVIHHSGSASRSANVDAVATWDVLVNSTSMRSYDESGQLVDLNALNRL